MRNNQYVIICLFLCLFLNQKKMFALRAQSSIPFLHHIIIAVDKAGCDDWIGSKETEMKIRSLLFGKNFESGHGRHHLFENGDYVSVVGFKINANQTDMDLFAMPMGKKTTNYSYQQYSVEQLDHILCNAWSDIVLQKFNPGANGFSLVSVAKAYALASLKSDEQMIGRTFLIMLTDRHYNGNNFYDEMQSLHWKQKDMKVSNPLTSEKIFERCYDVEHFYFIKYLSTDYIWQGKSYSPKGYVEFYEYVPLMQYFSLAEVVDYPSHISAKRQWNGKYRLEVPLSWRGNERYAFRHMEVFPNSSDSAVYNSPKEALAFNHLSDTMLTFVVPSDKSFRSLQLRAWLGLKDGFYNATLMSANAESPRELGRDGLNIQVPIEYEKDATIYGSTWLAKIGWIPLFWIDDQYMAAKVWEFLIPLLVIILLVLQVYRVAKPEYYEPTPSDFEINKKQTT